MEYEKRSSIWRKIWTHGGMAGLLVLGFSWVASPVQAVNAVPVSQPGGPYLIHWGESLTVDGSASFDPDAALGGDFAFLIYNWDLLDNGSVESFAASPTFDMDQLLAAGIHEPGTYLLRLRVADSFGATNTRVTTLTVTPTSIGTVPEPEAVALLVAGLGLASLFSNWSRL